MPAAADIILPVNPELPREAHVQLEAFARRVALPAPVMFAVDTALEELLQNVVDHSDAHEVTLRLSLESGEMRLEVADDGRPFNPLAVSGPDLSLPLAQRGIGGLGVHMIRRMMDRAVYEHRGGCNRVALAKVLA